MTTSEAVKGMLWRTVETAVVAFLVKARVEAGTLRSEASCDRDSLLRAGEVRRMKRSGRDSARVWCACRAERMGRGYVP